MVNIIPTISIIIPNVNDLYITIESERLSECIKRKKAQLYVVFKKSTLNIKHRFKSVCFFFNLFLKTEVKGWRKYGMLQ